MDYSIDVDKVSITYTPRLAMYMLYTPEKTIINRNVALTTSAFTTSTPSYTLVPYRGELKTSVHIADENNVVYFRLSGVDSL